MARSSTLVSRLLSEHGMAVVLLLLGILFVVLAADREPTVGVLARR